MSPDESLPERAAFQQLPWWQPWAALALFSFLLHILWEMLQVPLYQGMSDLPHSAGIWTRTKASAGDVGLTIAAYALVAMVRRTRAWILTPRARDIWWYDFRWGEEDVAYRPLIEVTR